ncbi:cytochrome P450 [Hymenobacter weizhouensis]|uniref:cytochrome P450 n=1 Tax=Hymenobacter sp. YIM 151500-1 TaxID=2987689 RepID=UPI002225F881|nr:cytochrome P450 [Hymenobacter sp. YIM 151500-1]UYZ64798.1 cytochrome P450 [Hymenobacter sp. YIM 151500-1]
MPAAASRSLPVIPRATSLRNSLRLAANPIPVLNRYLDEHGDTLVMYLGGVRKTLLTRDPGLIQHVLQKNHRNYPKSPLSLGFARYLGHGLLTSEGGYWLQQRRLIQPGFHRQRVAGLTELMSSVIEDGLRPLEEQAARQGGAVEVAAHELMTRLTFRIVARSVFSSYLPEPELQRMAELLTAVQAFYVRSVRQPYLRPWFALAGRFRHHDQLAQELRQLLLGYIRQRQAADPATPAPDDLLQMLLDARYESSGEAMTETQVLDEAVILLVAGHETSANALAWMWLLLAQHPEVVSRVQAEINQVLGSRSPTFADLPRLSYALHVVQETMRLYPPVWIMDRQAAAADEYQGIPIPKGTLISSYLYGVHHAAQLWPDPEVFRPERFGAEAGAQPPFAYVPFGGGPRQCIGNQFALTEMQLLLLEVVRRFEVEWVEGQPPVELQPLITLRPRHDFRVRFRLRR